MFFLPIEQKYIKNRNFHQVVYKFKWTKKAYV